jgi:hypothetical protein
MSSSRSSSALAELSNPAPIVSTDTRIASSRDALFAFVVHQSVPWPEFFMIETFGSAMFFAANAMHFLNIWIVTRDGVRDHFLGPDVRTDLPS